MNEPERKRRPLDGRRLLPIPELVAAAKRPATTGSTLHIGPTGGADSTRCFVDVADGSPDRALKA